MRKLFLILFFLLPTRAFSLSDNCAGAVIDEAAALQPASPDPEDQIDFAYRKDLTQDGLKDLLIGQLCGNHNCQFKIYKRLSDRRLCLMNGIIEMNKNIEAGIVAIRRSAKNEIQLVTQATWGVESGEVGVYQIQSDAIIRVKKLRYGSDVKGTYKEAVGIVELEGMEAKH